MMPTTLYNKTKRGFALSIVLWIVAILMLTVLYLSMVSKDNIKLSTKLEDKLVSRLEADSIFELLKFYVLTSDYDNISLINPNYFDLRYRFPERIILDNRWYILSGKTRFRIQDTSALFNSMNFPSKIIAELVSETQNYRKLDMIGDSILDWKDEDDFMLPSGAERRSYLVDKSVPYFPRNNFAMQAPEELRLIHGLDSLNQVEWENLKNRFYYGNHSVPNLALIEPDYLALILGVTQNEAIDLVQLRDESLEAFRLQLYSYPTFDESTEEMGLFISKQFLIEIEAYQNASKSHLKVLIDFRDQPRTHYELISYSIK